MDAATYNLGLQLLITPQMVLDEINTVNYLIVGLGKEIAASAAPADFKRNFALYYEEWQTFYADKVAGLMGWFVRGFGSTYDKVLDYKQRTLGWAKRYAELGYKPRVEIPEGIGVNAPSGWKALAIAGGVVTGAFLVVHAFFRRG